MASVVEWRCPRCGFGFDPGLEIRSGACCHVCRRVVCAECVDSHASRRSDMPVCRDCAAKRRQDAR